MTVEPRERLARVALNQLAEPGDPRMLGLVRRLGAREVYEALRAERDLDGALSDVAARLVGIDPARTLEQAERLGARFVVPGDAEWPAGLDALADVAPLHQRGGVPVGLWVRGPARLDALGSSVAVVGSRAATTYGAHAARDLAGEVARQQWGIVSGAAFGIDQAAHRAALAEGGTTVAVLACGIDRAYPAAHRELIAAIRERGAVVSEAPLGAAPMRVRFLARNRLIAGLTRGAVVVEAAVRSGALSTATWADRLHRPVMGVPGPVSSGLSQGVHHLIRSGGASLVTTGAEVLEMLAESGHWLAPVPRGLTSPRDVLSVRQRQLLDAVPVATGRPLSAIARAAGLAESMARREIEVLRDQGFVAPAGDGWRLGVAAR